MIGLVVLAIIAGCIVSRGVQMPTTDNIDKKYLQQIANQVLNKFKEISDEVSKKLNNHHYGRNSSEVLIGGNKFTSPNSVKQLAKIHTSEQKGYQSLLRKPAIARVLYSDEHNVEKIYYISSYAPPSAVNNVASYMSPVGRLASLDIGDECVLPDGKKVILREKITLHPHNNKGEWDALNSFIASNKIDRLTVKSLRQLLADLGVHPDDDPLASILAADAIKSNLFRGIQREIISRMGIRNQPILDKIQDDIFRLPINERIFLVGAPGTGKTTTLIKRLGQKSDLNNLSEEEKFLVNTAKQFSSLNHDQNWIMFTPTDLLGLYLRESFGRENIPVTDEHIKTWSYHRHSLAKKVFNILKDSKGNGLFILRDDDTSLLTKEALDNPKAWYTDFDRWQRASYAQELFESANTLIQSDHADISLIGQRYLNEITTLGNDINAQILVSLIRIQADTKFLYDKIANQINQSIRNIINNELAKNNKFLDSVAEILKTVYSSADSLDEYDDNEEDDDNNPTFTDLEKTKQDYYRVVKSYSKMIAKGRQSKSSVKFIRVINQSIGSSAEAYNFKSIGQNLILLDCLRSFKDPVKRYIIGISRRYQKFRQVSREAGKWYRPAKFDLRNIQPLEVDILLLAILRSADQLISKTWIQSEINQPEWAALRPMINCYYNQVLVDEATDFSPVQLACMAALTHPKMRSFFAAGDFNQRLTEWGAKGPDDLKWIFADLHIREVRTSYRHSEPLKSLAQSLVFLMKESHSDSRTTEPESGGGFKPALLENYSSRTTMLSWLAERIREIESFVKELPSIAIFVNSENEVTRLAEELRNILVENSINVVACSNGMVVGHGNDVRVFDIKHIKGLEFESVFFIDIDDLAEMKPHIFDKYLYVGLTRAATYLGLTCSERLPSKIESLRSHFTTDWQTH